MWTHLPAPLQASGARARLSSAGPRRGHRRRSRSCESRATGDSGRNDAKQRCESKGDPAAPDVRVVRWMRRPRPGFRSAGTLRSSASSRHFASDVIYGFQRIRSAVSPWLRPVPRDTRQNIGAIGQSVVRHEARNRICRCAAGRLSVLLFPLSALTLLRSGEKQPRDLLESVPVTRPLHPSDPNARREQSHRTQ